MVLKVIIFDFDGTIADTYDIFVEIVNELSGEFGYDPVAQRDLERLKHLSSREIIKEANISLIKIPFILKRVKSELRERSDKLTPIQGIQDCLLGLKEQGYHLGILTSNIKENVVAFLDNNQLNDTFDFIYSGTTLFGKHKVINRIIKHHHLSPKEVMYVGDETRDIQSAQKSQVLMTAVGWGFNSPQVLTKYHPDFIINQPYELLEVVGSLNPSRQPSLSL
ncbi:MAG: HAD hydrolase-like protein [Microcystaceae cyanobacterium]